MREEFQSELKQAQITSVRSMDDGDPSFFDGQYAQEDNPDINGMKISGSF